MTRCYPVFILDITVPFDSVDVNVHPSKAEVRFKDNGMIFSAVYSAVGRTLYECDTYIPDVKEVYEAENIEKPKTIEYSEISYSVPVNKPKFGFLNNIAYERSSTVNENGGISAQIIENILNRKPDEPFYHQDDIKDISASYKIIGQLFNTFFILEYGSDALIIDQHAAMERINYDLLKESFGREDFKQPMLLPYILHLNHYEYDFIENNISCFNEIGIEIEPFGNNTFKVGTVPSVLSDINLEDFFKSALSELIDQSTLKMGDLLKDKLAVKACRASIKGGDALSGEQIKMLLGRLKEGKIPLQCPHGRPAIVRLTRDELDKWFKRIV
jgi:DNA mismatch repair protein MutL